MDGTRFLMRAAAVAGMIFAAAPKAEAQLGDALARSSRAAQCKPKYHHLWGDRRDGDPRIAGIGGSAPKTSLVLNNSPPGEFLRAVGCSGLFSLTSNSASYQTYREGHLLCSFQSRISLLYVPVS